MAFNLQTFRTRTLTAVLFVIIMLTGLWLSPWSFFLLFTLIHFGCWNEYQQLISKTDTGYAEITGFHRYGVMLAGWCLMLWFSDDSLRLAGVRLHEGGWWLGLILVFLLPVSELLFTSNIRPKNIAYSFSGLIYISLTLALLVDLAAIQVPVLPGKAGIWKIIFSRPVPMIIILTLWVNDTMAYIVGSLVGKTPLSPVSPKKTWEGTAGGIILAVTVISLLCCYVFGSSNGQLKHWIILPALAAIAGTFGDLFESRLKRRAGVKDTGTLMPGHGGFLDRFDSLLLAAPVAWVYVILFM